MKIALFRSNQQFCSFLGNTWTLVCTQGPCACVGVWANMWLTVITLFSIISMHLRKEPYNSPGKWLHDWISYPSNRSKQIIETHTAYILLAVHNTHFQSLNEKQHTYSFTESSFVVCEHGELMNVVFHLNFVCRRYKSVWVSSICLDKLLG